MANPPSNSPSLQQPLSQMTGAGFAGSLSLWERARCGTTALVIVAVVLLVAAIGCSPPGRLTQEVSTSSRADQSGTRVRFQFALTGDQLYGPPGEGRYPALAANLDAARLDFVVFGGDFKDGSSSCDDATFEDRFARFNASVHPFIFLPGDNEWTDCWRQTAGGYDPIERLDKLRAMFSAGENSLGQTSLRLTRQSSLSGFEKYRENVRWIYGNVMF